MIYQKHNMSRQTQHKHNSNTYRFFIPPTSIQSDSIALEDGELAHQLGTVLRLGPGDGLTFLDGLGAEYSATLLVLERRSIQAKIISSRQSSAEPACELTLYCPLIRAERFEWLLQKGTELGVTRFVPVLYEHTVHGDRESAGRKSERWERIIREAAEQSCRGRLPILAAAMTFSQAMQEATAHDLPLVLWEGEQTSSLYTMLQNPGDNAAGRLRVAIMSGPEGGLSQAEVEQAKACGIATVTLGKRILRAETAPLVALSAILYALGEL